MVELKLLAGVASVLHKGIIFAFALEAIGVVLGAVSVDCLPLVSQIKSGVEMKLKATGKAVRTQNSFSRLCPGISQVRSAVELICLRPEAAWQTQVSFWTHLSVCVNAIPVVGHAKAHLHRLLGNEDGYKDALKRANISMAGLGEGNHVFTENTFGDSCLSVGWEQHRGYDSKPGENVFSKYIGHLSEEEGIRQCRVLAEANGWGGFVVSFDVAYFREANGDDLLNELAIVPNRYATLHAFVPHWQKVRQAPAPPGLLLLEFGRMTRFDEVLLNCPLAQSLQQAGVDIMPTWANGAKILVPGVDRRGLEDRVVRKLCHRSDGRRYVIVADESGKRHLQEALYDIKPYEKRPRVKSFEWIRWQRSLDAAGSDHSDAISNRNTMVHGCSELPHGSTYDRDFGCWPVRSYEAQPLEWRTELPVRNTFIDIQSEHSSVHATKSLPDTSADRRQPSRLQIRSEKHRVGIGTRSSEQLGRMEHHSHVLADDSP